MNAIENITELKNLSEESGIECFVRLNFGAISRKHIWWDASAKHFEVVNYIDSSTECLTEEEFLTHPILGAALQHKALILEE